MKLHSPASKVAIAFGGYVAAVGGSVALTLFLLLLPTALPDNGAWGSLYRNIDTLPLAAFLGLVATFVSALPGFLGTVGFAALANWRGWLPFTIAGGADALLAHLLFDATLRVSTPTWFVAASVPGGLAGGFIYWASAGRFLARQQELEAA